MKTKKILWLSLRENLPLDNMSEFMDLIYGRGAKADCIEGDPPIAASHLQNRIREADSYILTLPDVIGFQEEGWSAREELKRQIECGKRMLVLRSDEELNEFLIDFDMAITDMKIFNPAIDPGREHRSDLIQRQTQSSYLAMSLLNGQNELTVHTPYLVWYGSTATPLLLSDKDCQLINRRDYFERTGNRVLTCAVAWPTGNPDEARVLTLAGATITDSGSTMGIHFPGIRANRVFAKNLVSWLRYELEVQSTLINSARELLDSLEVVLFDLVENVLKTKYGAGQWMDLGFPEEVHAKASQLHLDSHGSIPKEHALYFDDFRKIVSTNWTIFEHLFRVRYSTKRKFGKMLSKLNNIRNRVAHPKRLLSAPLKGNEVSELRHEHDWLRQVLDGLQTTPRDSRDYQDLAR